MSNLAEYYDELNDRLSQLPGWTKDKDTGIARLRAQEDSEDTRYWQEKCADLEAENVALHKENDDLTAKWDVERNDNCDLRDELERVKEQLAFFEERANE